MKNTLTKAVSEYLSTNRKLRAFEFISWIILIGFVCILFIKPQWKDPITSEIYKILPLFAVLFTYSAATRLLRQDEFLREKDQGKEAIYQLRQAIGVANNLRERVRYLKKCLVEGDRPFLALSENAETIKKHYDFLSQSNVYKFISDNEANLIRDLAGSIFGLTGLVTGINSSLKLAPHETFNPQGDIDKLELFEKNSFEHLEQNLTLLCSSLIKLKEIEEQKQTHLNKAGL